MAAQNIALIEPFFTGSHQRWAEELQRHSSHSIDLFTLPGRHWKWRMHGAAITLAEKLLAAPTDYDLILATDMLDLGVFLSLIRHRYPQIPAYLYFHENQLSYPWSPTDQDPDLKRDRHYAFINYTSALVADRIFFNSDYHRHSFLNALPHFLSAYPDFENKHTAETIAAKSSTLPLGLDLAAFNQHRPTSSANRDIPLILWNHRWEYDKHPEAFAELLHALLDRNLAFEVALLGERFKKEPPYFPELRARLGDRLVAYGHADSFADYASWLRRADILPVTSRQDFFGGSVVEAIYCGVHPILPNRLAYPNHIDSDAYPNNYYSSQTELIEKTAALIESGTWKQPSPHASSLSHYDWSNLAATYDQAFAASAARPHTR